MQIIGRGVGGVPTDKKIKKILIFSACNHCGYIYM